MPQVEINYLAVLVAAVIPMVIGSFWYSPVLFGNQWMKLAGFSKEQIEKAKKDKAKMQKAYMGSAVAALLMSYVLANFVDYANAVTFVQGAMTGFWAWLGFAAASSLPSYLFEGRPVKLWKLNTGYNLVSLLLIGGLLAVWT